jgi:tetratricopeptide (TPR) repeat protein
MGDYLFTQNQERKEIYFLQEGEFKITAYQVTHKKINLIISQLGNFKFDKIDYADIGTGIDIPLTYARKGDILGMDDLLYDNKFFCSAVCISKKASFFALDINIFENICKYYPKVLENYKRIEIDKKVLMIQKFQGVKYTNKNSLSGEFRKDDENAIFWKSSVNDNEDYKQYYLNTEKKYSKLGRFNTIVNSFDKSLLNNRNTIVEKKIDSYTLNKIKLKLLKEQNNISLPPINQINDFNSNNLISKTINADNSNNKNSRIFNVKKVTLYKPKIDSS